MPGVKKIGIDYSKKNPILVIDQNKKWIYIKPDEWVHLKVIEWLPGTTEEQKKKPLTWIRQRPDRKTIINQVHGSTYSLRIFKKGSGPQGYYVEASLGGKPDFKNEVGLYIGALSNRRITKTEWRLTKSGKSIKNKNNTNYISYGDEVFLYAFTEGMNGINNIVVEIYNQQLGSNRLIKTYKKVACVEGEIFLQIRDTSTWRTSVRNLQNIEQFYVKIKCDNQYIIDKYGDDEHAIYLNVKNELSSNNPKPPVNNTPTKVYKPDVNAERYEPCKFEAIKITESSKKNGSMVQEEVVVFRNGKNLSKVISTKEHINRSIYFKFDSAIIDKDGEKKLNNILRFLLDHEHSTIVLNGFACVIGKREYNKSLSQVRSDVVKKFFFDGGLAKSRIQSTGYGEVEPSDDKGGRDNIVYKDESKNIEARRVDIKFIFYGHDANTIVYETIAPSIEKPITIDIMGYNTSECFRGKDKHEKLIKIIDAGQQLEKGDPPSRQSPPSFQHIVHSDLKENDLAPIKYIWPKRPLPNLVYFYINSCRYFSKKNEATLMVKVYPDIKWTLNFFLNLTNYLSVNWQNQTASAHKKLQEKAGKIGAEKRWKQKDVSFGFSLKGEWNMNSSGSYGRSKELKTEYETKFKKLYNLFSSVGDMSSGITNKTKGQVRNMGMKGVPMTFVIKPPNVKLNGVWNLERAKANDVKTETIGTKVDLSLKAEPLIGLEITIDLLCSTVGLVAGAVSGGTAAPGATKLYGIIKDTMNTGVNIGNDKLGVKASSDVYIDLVISSIIKTGIEFSFNTANSSKDSKTNLEVTNKLKVELKAGVWAKAEVSMVIVKIDGYFEMSGKGNASITFGNNIKYDNKGLYYRPELGFDGLNAEYVVKGNVGMSTKKKVLGTNPSSSDGKVIAEGKYFEIIHKFDVIKSLEELFGFQANIPLIRREDD